jgi:hypothetical protein
MRPILLVVGVIVLLTGLVWALQGAYVLPATFMRGEAWIGLGSAIAVAGLGLVWLGVRPARSAPGSSPRDE